MALDWIHNVVVTFNAQATAVRRTKRCAELHRVISINHASRKGKHRLCNISQVHIFNRIESLDMKEKVIVAMERFEFNWSHKPLNYINWILSYMVESKEYPNKYGSTSVSTFSNLSDWQIHYLFNWLLNQPKYWFISMLYSNRLRSHGCLIRSASYYFFPDRWFMSSAWPVTALILRKK